MRHRRWIPWGVAAALIAGGLYALSTTGRAAPDFSHANVTTVAGGACNKASYNDAQLNECLVGAIALLREKMATALAAEAPYVSSTSAAEGRRLATASQTTFAHYARAECLAEANPYATGTIAPIIYGRCVIRLDQQRLRLLNENVKFFREGGESAKLA